MNPHLWSWLLMAGGVTGLYLAGRRHWIGWAIGLGTQVLWLAYSISTRQWGFLVSCLIYAVIHLHNLLDWRTEQMPLRVVLEPLTSRLGSVVLAAMAGHKSAVDYTDAERDAAGVPVTAECGGCGEEWVGDAMFVDPWNRLWCVNCVPRLDGV
jgi:hypothetical protein